MSETDPFRIRGHVPEFDVISEGYRRVSDIARRTWASQADISYGPTTPERLDLFFPTNRTEAAPIHVFIHGGYWRANTKDDYAFVANTVCAAGSIAAVLGYGRLPEHRMSSLVGQVRRASHWLQANAASFGGDPLRMSASGHSAGAHLAFFLAARGHSEMSTPLAAVKSLLLVSGIYDLGPIATSFLQPELQLNADEIAQWSPITSPSAPGSRLSIAVGGHETLPFRDQAVALGGTASPVVKPLLVEDANHMTIVRDMGIAGSAMGSVFRRFLCAA